MVDLDWYFSHLWSSVQSDHQILSLNEALSPDSSYWARQSVLESVRISPNFFHFKLMETAVLLRTFSAADFFLYTFYSIHSSLWALEIDLFSKNVISTQRVWTLLYESLSGSWRLNNLRSTDMTLTPGKGKWWWGYGWYHAHEWSKPGHVCWREDSCTLINGCHLLCGKTQQNSWLWFKVSP